MMEEKLPKGWSSNSLKDLLSFVIGGDWGKDPNDISEEDYVPVAVIRGSEIKNWRKDKGSTASIRIIKQNSLEKRNLIEGDILIEISGGGPDQPVGRVILIDEETLSKNSDLPKIGTNFLRLLRANQKFINAPFLNYYLSFFYLSGKVIEYQGGSNNLRNLKYKEFEKIQIPHPPLPEQQRIVAKLDTLFGHLDRAREKLDGIPTLLKNFRQQVLTQAVTGELTKEWREGKGLGEWEIQKADKCCIKVQSGGTPKSDGFAETGVPFLKVYNIVNNKIDFDYKPQFVTPEAHNSKIKKSILLPGDVLMNIVGPPLNKIAIVPDDFDEWNLNQAITLFRPKEYLNNKFLYYFFCEGSSVRSVHNETRGVVGQVNISLSQCRSFEIPVPSIEEQQEIVKRIDALFSLADKIESKYQSIKAKIDQLPQAILAKAFRGELVEQEVKGYEVEEREGLMAAEGRERYGIE